MDDFSDSWGVSIVAVAVVFTIYVSIYGFFALHCRCSNDWHVHSDKCLVSFPLVSTTF